MDSTLKQPGAAKTPIDPVDPVDPVDPIISPGAGDNEQIACSESELPEADETILQSEGQDLSGVLSGINQTAYVWEIASDRFEWESNAAEVLGIAGSSNISTGAEFHKLIAPEHLARRTGTILSARSNEIERGVPYRVQYRFRPAGLRSRTNFWLEDYGRWWPGEDGKALYARGGVRVVSDGYVEHQRLLCGTDHDELTGQLNRIHLMEALVATVDRAKRASHPYVLFMAGVDNLAVLNETFGFDVGDQIIAAVAHAIKGVLRDGDTVGRYSSNKFGIILHDCDPESMAHAAERLMKAVRRTNIATSACQLSATISIGSIAISAETLTADQAISCALSALDQASLNHSDTYIRFEKNRVRENSRSNTRELCDEIISALDGDRIKIVMQPMVSTQTGEPAYYECLARLFKEDGGMIQPGEFIPVSERVGLSRLIDRRIMEQSVALLEKHADLQLSINVSSLTTSDPDWISALRGLLEGDRSMAERLVVEITETAAIHDINQTVLFVDTVKELGCRVAIDDFGAGYTSFKNLKHLPVDIVKIDGSFVKNLASDSSDRVFIKAMVELARSLGMKIVAEWVTDQESAELLQEAGIDYLQGFLFGQPFSPEELGQARVWRAPEQAASSRRNSRIPFFGTR